MSGCNFGMVKLDNLLLLMILLMVNYTSLFLHIIIQGIAFPSFSTPSENLNSLTQSKTKRFLIFLSNILLSIFFFALLVQHVPRLYKFNLLSSSGYLYTWFIKFNLSIHNIPMSTISINLYLLLLNCLILSIKHSGSRHCR